MLSINTERGKSQNDDSGERADERGGDHRQIIVPIILHFTSISDPDQPAVPSAMVRKSSSLRLVSIPLMGSECVW